MSNPSKTDLAWAAGLFEGEGCVGHSRSGHWLRMNMTDLDIVERFASVLGLKVYGPYRTAHQDQWLAACSSFERTQAVAAMLWPWLGSRRRVQVRRALSG